jgi:hypothetical protein
MSHGVGDAIFDSLQICRDGVRFIFGIVPPTNPQASPGNRLRAIYRRIQAASPPPDRVDGSAWESGICVGDDRKNCRPLRPADGDDSWKRLGVYYIEDIASLDQPKPGAIVLDQWLTVAVKPTTRPFSAKDRLGFLSAFYPQPVMEGAGRTCVEVDYNATFDLKWSTPLEPGSWVAISFDRFWPPERESVEYIAQIQEECDHATSGGQDQATQATAGSA